MNSLLLANAFAAGTLAALNPCALAMLPSLVSFYLGVNSQDYGDVAVGRRVGQALGIAGITTAGFLTVFIIGGTLLGLGLNALMDWAPYLMIPVALSLILLGIFLLTGRSISLSLPGAPALMAGRGGEAGLFAMYLYGVGYALSSLACTLPVFVFVVSGAAAAGGGPIATLAIFAVFALGMGAVLLAVALGAVLFQGAVSRWLRRFVPYIRKLSAVLLVAAGIYLLGYMLYFYFGVGRAMPPMG